MNDVGRRGARWVAAACVVSIPFACGGTTSDNGGSAGSGTVAGTCQSVCEKILSIKCPADDQTTCLSDCQNSFGQYQAQCPSQTSSVLGCIQTKVTLTCDANGNATADPTQLTPQCGTQDSALFACTACLPASGDTNCRTCGKTNCCFELQAYTASALDYSHCVNACSDTTCSTNCANKFPELQPKFDALSNCQIQKCSGC